MRIPDNEVRVLAYEDGPFARIQAENLGRPGCAELGDAFDRKSSPESFGEEKGQPQLDAGEAIWQPGEVVASRGLIPELRVVGGDRVHRTVRDRRPECFEMLARTQGRSHKETWRAPPAIQARVQQQVVKTDLCIRDLAPCSRSAHALDAAGGCHVGDVDGR